MAVAGPSGGMRQGRARAVSMRLNSNNRNDEVPVGDRLLSALPYLLPIADGIGYSK